MKVAKQCKSNPKKFCQLVNKKKQTYSAVGNLTVKQPDGTNITIDKDCEKVDIFADYFESVYSVEADQNFTQLASRMPPNSMPSVLISKIQI